MSSKWVGRGLATLWTVWLAYLTIKYIELSSHMMDLQEELMWYTN